MTPIVLEDEGLRPPRSWTGGRGRGWRLARGLALVGAVAATAAAVWSAIPRRPPDFAAVPLDRSAYLKDVAEPITIEGGIPFSDGGSLGLVFRDARGVRRAACLEADGDFGPGRTLALGQVIPGGRRVPIRGAEERAFIGLLQRWGRADPEARAWLDRSARDPRRPVPAGAESPERQAKGFAVGMIRNLLRRY